MRSLWPQLAAWLDAREAFALATVSATSGSAPRAPGACMAIMPDHARFLGSVSSGCLDAEVVEAARAALRTGVVQRLRFGPDGKPPWSDGLTCGGWVEVRVESWWGHHARHAVRDVASQVRSWLEHDTAGVVLSDDTHHCAIDARDGAGGDVAAFGPELIACARAHLRDEQPSMECGESTGPEGARVFLRAVRRRPRLILIGAVDVAAHLVALSRATGWTTIVIEPRAAYAASERFIQPPDEVVRAWPQERIAQLAPGPRDAAVTLTHDPKIDDAALRALLRTRTGYIGALGSTRSHTQRLARLRADVPDENALARIHGPAGLHLGAPDPAGIAAGILAGIVQWRAQAERARFVAALTAVVAR